MSHIISIHTLDNWPGPGVMCMSLENEDHTPIITGRYIAESMDISTNMALVMYAEEVNNIGWHF